MRGQENSEAESVDLPAEKLEEETSEESSKQEANRGTDGNAIQGKSLDSAKLPQAVPTIPLRPNSSPQLTSPSGPDVYMLPDEEGKLQMILGFRYEDFLRTWQHQDQAINLAPPPYVFDSVEVSGEADDALAKLRVTIDLLTQASGWVEVPLQMSSLIVQKYEIEKETDGECVVFDPDRQSYYVWLKSRPGSRRQLVLHGLLRLKVESGEPSMELSVPRAAQSSLSLRVPAATAQFQAPLGMTVESVTSVGQETQVRLTGLASPMRLQWKVPQAKPSQSSALIEAAGRQTVRITQRAIRYNVNLTIDSFGTPLDRVRVRLPVGSIFVNNTATSEYQVELLSSDSTGGGDRQVVEVRTLQPRKLPWQVQLAAEQSIEKEDEQFACSISGFEVLDAYRQSGSFDLKIDDPLQAYYDLSRNLEQHPPSDRPLQKSEVKTIARFAYSQFPWELTVHILPRQQRVSVRPQYELSIDSGEARLHADFDYQLTGARTFFLRLDMHGWSLTDDPLESGGTVDQDLYTITQQGLLNLPLLNPDTPRVRLSFVAGKEVQLGLNTFALPEPLGVFVANGTLQVRCEPAWEFLPKLSASEGLSRVAVDRPAPARGQGAHQSSDTNKDREISAADFVFRTYQAAPTLEANLTQRDREVAAQIHTEAVIEPQWIHVSQKIEYEVKFRPISQLLMRISEELWLNESLTVLIDGEEAQYGLEVDRQDDTASNTLSTVSEETDVRRIVIALPRPHVGKLLLELSYDTTASDLTGNISQSIRLPLAVPDDFVTSHRVRLKDEQSLRATLDQSVANDDWHYLGNGEDLSKKSGEIELLSSTSPFVLPLLLQLNPEEEPKLATLESAWLQNWILAGRQQVRAVFRFRSPFARVFVQLPEKLDASGLEVLLEQHPISFEYLSGDRLGIDLPAGKTDKSQTLELRYQSSAKLSDWGSHSARLPALESRSSNTLVYWQLILPSNWHIFTEPEKLTGDYRLGWKGYRWGRQPNLYQAELERLTGAAPLPPPPETMNQYLFQTFQLTSEIEVFVLRRSWFVFGSTLLAFGMGLLCLYTSLVRRKEFWLILALSLFALVFSFPEVSQLVVQVILWSGVMTLLAAVLKRIVVPPESDLLLTPDMMTAATAATESWSRAEIGSPSSKQQATASVQVGPSE